MGIYKNPRNYNTLRFLAVILPLAVLLLAGKENARAQGSCRLVVSPGGGTRTEDHCDHPDYEPELNSIAPDYCSCVLVSRDPGPTEPPCYWRGYSGVETGLGCIPVEPEGLVFWGLRFIIGIAGGLALLLLLFGGIKYITSKGDPKALQSASSTMTSALGGFLLIILSVLILRVIGYEIFRLPGWGIEGGKLKLPGG